MDSQGGGASRPCQGWHTLDDNPLGQIVSRSGFLTSARLSGTCTKYFKGVHKYAWEKAMLVGLRCVLEDEDVSLGVSPVRCGRSCKLKPLEMPMLRGTHILSDEQVRLGASGDWLAYVWEGSNINLYNIYNGDTVPIKPLSNIGISHAMGHRMNWYDGTTVRLKKIAIPKSLIRSSANQNYTLIAVFDIAIAFTNPAHGDQRWTMLSAADLLPYEYKDVLLLSNRIFAVANQATCLWDTSYGN
ncbi:uncharacterized protein [Triticum aestivum]|uniref:uncharacterized protein n=1 Tax=Triticum aestivum TaxID=4565 RepID=UPI001D00A133|nr:uncharacterized protein LOC123091977 [Triticum aestivum]